MTNLELYTWNTPNGRKGTIMLEECGLDYDLIPINIREGAQKKPDYLKINPNGRIPALFDREADMRVFESGAMLVYLGEKTGQFLPTSGTERAEVMGWTFWQVGGLGPMLGQYGHFNGLDEEHPYSIQRYRDESVRLLTVMDEHLKTQDYLATEYSIADMMNYPWAVMGMNAIGSKHSDLVEPFEALKSWINRVGERPAVQKGVELLAELSKSRY